MIEDAAPSREALQALPHTERAALADDLAGYSVIKGLRVAATDGPFPAAGTGTVVSGSTLVLTMAMAGCAAYCDDLTGPGVVTLRERCATA